MDGSFVHEEIFSEEGDNDLSCWVFINSSETQSDDDVISLDDGIASSRSSISSSSALKIGEPIEDHVDQVDGDGDFGCHKGDFNGKQVGANVVHGDLGYCEEEENVDDGVYHVDDGDGYDLDDELVPWTVSGKVGRQRMRKLGKRSFAKMNNSKRSPYSYVKPGCVRGKHGLGLKHNC